MYTLCASELQSYPVPLTSLIYSSWTANTLLIHWWPSSCLVTSYLRPVKCSVNINLLLLVIYPTSNEQQTSSRIFLKSKMLSGDGKKISHNTSQPVLPIRAKGFSYKKLIALMGLSSYNYYRKTTLLSIFQSAENGIYGLTNGRLCHWAIFQQFSNYLKLAVNWL